MSSVFRLLLTRNASALTLFSRGSPRTPPTAHAQLASRTFALNQQIAQARLFSNSSFLHCVVKRSDELSANENTEQERNPLDRTQVISLEQSQRYLASEAYQQTYGSRPIWEQYRRNHKGPFAPRRTRKTCVRKGMISTGNPCPICRDEYLLLDHRNLELLNQFISPHTGETLSYSKTGLCQKKHQQLLLAIERARDQGLITYDVPFRQYDYAEYYPTELLEKAGQSN